MQIQDGEKIAKARAARLIEAKTGTLAIEVAFEFMENNQVTHLSWQGWLSANAKERTVETLTNVLGYNGGENCDAPDFLDFGREVKIVIENEHAKDEQGNLKYRQDGSPMVYPKIKWVNSIGGGQFAGIEPQIAKQKLQASGLKAAFLAMKKPTQSAGNSVPNMAPGGFNANEKIPF